MQTFFLTRFFFHLFFYRSMDLHFRATRRSQRGVVSLTEDGYLMPTANGTSFFVSSIVTMMFEITSGYYENIKDTTCNLPGRRTFQSSTQNVSTENFAIRFFRYLTKKRLVFVALMFSVGEIPRKPSDPSSSYPKNNVSLGPRAVSLA